MNEGWIYILINPAFKKDLLKIGKTKRQPEERAKELSTTGIKERKFEERKVF